MHALSVTRHAQRHILLAHVRVNKPTPSARRSVPKLAVCSVLCCVDFMSSMAIQFNFSLRNEAMIAAGSSKSRVSVLQQVMSLRSQRQALLIEIHPLQGRWQMVLGGVGYSSVRDHFFFVHKPALNMHRHSTNNATLICMRMMDNMDPRKKEMSASTRVIDLVSRSHGDKSTVASVLKIIMSFSVVL